MTDAVAVDLRDASALFSCIMSTCTDLVDHVPCSIVVSEMCCVDCATLCQRADDRVGVTRIWANDRVGSGNADAMMSW